MPEDVTVPDRVMPLTEPVPPTEVTVPPGLDDAMVIEPLPLVMVMFEPAVKVALLSVLPDELPISNWPSVYEVCPVPPLATGKVPVT